MSLGSVTGYLTTMQEVLAHWQRVDGAVKRPVLLFDGTRRDQFAGQLAEVRRVLSEVEAWQVARDQASATREHQKAEILGRLVQFNRGVRAAFFHTLHEKDLPRAPSVGVAEARFLPPLQTMMERWKVIDALAPGQVAGFEPPLFLPPDDYHYAQFVSDLTNLKAAFEQVRANEAALANATKERDAHLRAARVRMVDYRRRVRGLFAKDDPIAVALPVLFIAAPTRPKQEKRTPKNAEPQATNG